MRSTLCLAGDEFTHRIARTFGVTESLLLLGYESTSLKNGVQIKSHSQHLIPGSFKITSLHLPEKPWNEVKRIQLRTFMSIKIFDFLFNFSIHGKSDVSVYNSIITM